MTMDGFSLLVNQISVTSLDMILPSKHVEVKYPENNNFYKFSEFDITKREFSQLLVFLAVHRRF